MNESEQRNLKIITDVCEAFNRHDAAAILAQFTDDAEWLTSRGTQPDGQTLHGKEAIGAMLAQRFSLIPDMSWEIHSHWVGGDRGCSEWTVSGTESNGNRLNWLGCDLWVLRDDGMITRKDTYWKYEGGE